MVYAIEKLIIVPIYKIWIRKVEGIENIPRDKHFIVAANHSSYFDTFLLPVIILSKLNKKMHALVDSTYWNNFITRAFLDLWECVPVFVNKEENSREKNKQALEKALNYLSNGDILIIFPEGGRSKNGKLQKAYTGIAKLALSSKVDVLPCGIIDAHKVLPVGSSLPRFKRCEVKIGKLIHLEKYYNKKTDKIALEEATRSIMKEIAKLIGQEYDY